MGSFRVDKVASSIRQIVSEAIANKLHDPRISPMTSVTRVEVSGDLQLAKIFVSVLGRESAGRKTIAGLTHAVGHVQRMVAAGLNLRRCPEIQFVLDPSLKKTAEIMQVIDETIAEDLAAHRSARPDEDVPDGQAPAGGPQ